MFQTAFVQGIEAATRAKTNLAEIRSLIDTLIGDVSVASRGAITASFRNDQLRFAATHRRNLGLGIEVATIEPAVKGYPVRITSEGNRVVTCPDRDTLVAELTEVLRRPATGDIVQRLLWSTEGFLPSTAEIVGESGTPSGPIKG